MRALAIVAILIALPSVPGCSSDCSVPANASFDFAAVDQPNNSVDTCPADIVSAFVAGSTNFFLGSASSCGGTLVAFMNAFSELSGDAECNSSGTFEVDDLEPSGGSGTVTVNIVCNDGTMCTEAFRGTLTH